MVWNHTKFKIQKKIFYFLVMDLSTNFDFFLIFKIYTQIRTQKLENVFCVLNYLIRNLQEIC